MVCLQLLLSGIYHLSLQEPLPDNYSINNTLGQVLVVQIVLHPQPVQVKHVLMEKPEQEKSSHGSNQVSPVHQTMLFIVVMLHFLVELQMIGLILITLLLKDHLS